MSANRWNSSLKDILNLIDQDDSVLDDVVFKSIIPKVVTGEEPVQGETPAGDAELLSRIPSELPILPLRGLVVSPQTAVPLSIGQPRSIRLVDEVVAGADKLIGLIASRDPDLEAPEPDDLYTIGTVALVQRLCDQKPVKTGCLPCLELPWLSRLISRQCGVDYRWIVHCGRP